MESRMVRIWRAGDQLPVAVSILLSIPSPSLVHTLQYVQAYAAQLVDVWMVDLGEEADFWWSHWVVVWKEELEAEGALCIGRCISILTLSWTGSASYARKGSEMGRLSSRRSIGGYHRVGLR